MKLHDTTVEIKTNIKATAKVFTINASQKAFKILSSNLYQNKIGAIIRELSTNAVDAHKAAGTSEPFEVHLPTSFEPYFYVKDYGTGLSHEDVLNLYTSYFSSTKTDSDDYIGALGLGSKSPFSYVDSFSIESIFKGKKGIYNAMISTEGFPEILHITTVDTPHEKNGLKISFPVKESDIPNFTQNAYEIFYAFEEKPLISGGTSAFVKVSSSYTQPEEILSLPDLTLFSKAPTFFKNSYYNGLRSNAYVKMGNILYPIEAQGVFPLAETMNQEDLNFSIRNYFVYSVPLGSCDISPSRESLSYDPQTLEFLQNLFLQTKDRVVKEYILPIIESSEGTPWEKMMKVNSIFPNLQQVLTLDKVSPDFSFPINKPISFVTPAYISGHSLEKSTRGLSLSSSSSLSFAAGGNFTVHVFPNKNTLFLSLKGAKFSNYISSRLKYYMQENNFKVVYLADDFEVLTEWETILGKPPVMKAKELPLTPAQVKFRESLSTPKIGKGSADNDPLEIFSLKELLLLPYPSSTFSEKFPQAGGTYVVRKNKSFYIPNPEGELKAITIKTKDLKERFQAILSNCSNLVSFPTIFCFSLKEYKRNKTRILRELTPFSLKMFCDYTEKVYEKVKQDIGLKSTQDFSFFYGQEYLVKAGYSSSVNQEAKDKILDKDSLFLIFIQKVEERESQKQGASKDLDRIKYEFSRLSRCLLDGSRNVLEKINESITSGEDTYLSELRGILKNFEATYPLLYRAFKSDRISQIAPEEYLDYINLIDSKKS